MQHERKCSNGHIIVTRFSTHHVTFFSISYRHGSFSLCIRSLSMFDDWLNEYVVKQQKTEYVWNVEKVNDHILNYLIRFRNIM